MMANFAPAIFPVAPPQTVRPPYMVYVTERLPGDGLVGIQEIQHCFLYISEIVMTRLVLGIVHNPIEIFRVQRPAPSQEYPPPIQFSDPFENL